MLSANMNGQTRPIPIVNISEFVDDNNNHIDHDDYNENVLQNHHHRCRRVKKSTKNRHSLITFPGSSFIRRSLSPFRWRRRSPIIDTNESKYNDDVDVDISDLESRTSSTSSSSCESINSFESCSSYALILAA
ncbi:hypothetical protein BLA29_013184 [Euroglyphus maynei]|uniref:Uncharacterized protein n=1 Tax=Euroglyphus maynei TaxID=6958 RepID=A0A1Y3AZY8_EURMA|nr:hypothetical protein BLA29_013184 [Euroglyphus maynei]